MNGERTNRQRNKNYIPPDGKFFFLFVFFFWGGGGAWGVCGGYKKVFFWGGEGKPAINVQATEVLLYVV